MAHKWAERLPEEERTPPDDLGATGVRRRRPQTRAILVRDLPRLSDLQTAAKDSGMAASTRGLSLTELSGNEKRLAKFGKNSRLVELMKDGMSARAALEALGGVPTRTAVRQSQRLLKRAEQRNGDVMDQRWGRVTERSAPAAPLWRGRG
jgi:hypothetical protein